MSTPLFLGLGDVIDGLSGISTYTIAVAVLVVATAVASVVTTVVLVRRRGGLRTVGRVAVDKLLGRPEQYSYRLFSVLIVLSLMGIAVSGWAFSRSAAEIKTGSGGLAKFVLGWGTNFTLWAGLTVLATAVLFHKLNPTLASKTAKETRFTEKEVEHIAAEAKTTDGTSRLIGGTRHSVDQLRAKLLRVFNDEELDEGVEALDNLAPDSKIERSQSEHGGAIEPRIAGSLPAPGDEGAPEFRESDGDLENQAELDVLLAALDAELLTSQIDYKPDRTRPVSAPDAGVDDAPVEESESDAAGGDDGLDPVGVLQRKFQLARMDAAAAASSDELFARFVVPAALTALGCFTVFGTFWLHPVLYLAVASVSVLVGSAVYTGFKWRRRKNVEKARETSDYGGWSACDALAKKCTTERGTEFYCVWMGGKRYFGFDKHRLARKVADRWHQRLNGHVVAPAIHEHFAKGARTMMPLTHHIEYRDDRRGRGAIYDTIADVIRAADDGIVPKMHLAEMVVDRGPEYGFDPDLVADVYTDMVGEALEEFEVRLRDTNGEFVPVTLVTLRTMGIPIDMEELRSEFSNQVSPEDDPLYELPEVEETFDIEDALTVGVPPGVDPAEWDRPTDAGQPADGVT